MGAHVAGELVKAMTKRAIHVQGSRILVLGLTFKENCPDIRNTRVVDIVHELTTYGVQVDVYDPWVDADAAKHEYGIGLLSQPEPDQYDAIVLAVKHDQFVEMGVNAIRVLGKAQHVLYDLKYLFDKEETDLRL